MLGTINRQDVVSKERKVKCHADAAQRDHIMDQPSSYTQRRGSIAPEFGHLPLNAPGDAKGVSSYQPGATPRATPQEQVRESIAERQRRDSSVHHQEPPAYPEGLGQSQT